MTAYKNFSWSLIGESVRGCNHIRNGLPNQDSMHFHQSLTGNWLIAVISDGHGGKTNFRSDVGSQLAVNVTKDILESFLHGLTSNVSLSLIKRTLQEKIPNKLIKQWQQNVLMHVKQAPFLDKELEQLPAEDKELILKKPTIAYGATLLATIISNDFIAYLQIGDGEIVNVSSVQETTCPIIKNNKLIANETTSLCLENAWNEFEVHFQIIKTQPPALILMCSDGYVNSFNTYIEFKQAGVDFLNLLQSEGRGYVRECISSWLEETSEKGSGDDITLIVIYKDNNDIGVD